MITDNIGSVSRRRECLCARDSRRLETEATDNRACAWRSHLCVWTPSETPMRKCAHLLIWVCFFLSFLLLPVLCMMHVEFCRCLLFLRHSRLTLVKNSGAYNTCCSANFLSRKWSKCDHQRHRNRKESEGIGRKSGVNRSPNPRSSLPLVLMTACPHCLR